MLTRLILFGNDIYRLKSFFRRIPSVQCTEFHKLLDLNEGLIKFVEEKVMIEHTSAPNKPIYLLGESFGGALALSVAARNPTIDLILVVANPGHTLSYFRFLNFF